MNIIACTAVCMRFFALMVFFFIYKELFAMVSWFTETSSYEGWYIPLIMLIFFILVAIFMWVFAIDLAKKIVPKEVSVELESTNNLQHPSYQLAFVLLGVYVLIYGISDLFLKGQLYFLMVGESFGSEQLIRGRAAFISAAFESAMGLILIFGAKGISRLIHKIRYSGL